MTTTIKTLCAASALALLSAVSLAKLPPPSDAAKAKADEAKAKAAWTAKVGGYKLCLAQERVVAHYKKVPAAKPAAKPVAKGAAPAAGACADPGPFVYAPNAAAATAAATPAAPAAVAAAKKP